MNLNGRFQQWLVASFTSAVLLLPLALTGCGSSADGQELIRVKGSVTFEGIPVEEGRILFRMANGDQKAFSAEIKQGNYVIEAAPGKSVVEITTSRFTGEYDTSNPDDPPQPIGEMYIPEIYNSQTTLTADLSTASDNTLPFDLKAQ